MSTEQRNTTSGPTWEIVPGMRVWVGGHDTAAKRAIEPMVSGAIRPHSGPVDAVFICPRTADEATYFATKLRPRLRTGGAVWIVFGRDSEATSEDLDRRIESVKKEMASVGLIGCSRLPVGNRAVALGFCARSA